MWVVAAFGALAIAALRCPSTPASADPRAASPRIYPAAITPALLLVAIGAMPYAGIRTHPAFAMFSNLRVEGPRPNHWIMRRPATSDEYFVPAEYARSIEIVHTDLPALRHLQECARPGLIHTVHFVNYWQLALIHVN